MWRLSPPTGVAAYVLLKQKNKSVVAGKAGRIDDIMEPVQEDRQLASTLAVGLLVLQVPAGDESAVGGCSEHNSTSTSLRSDAAPDHVGSLHSDVFP